MNLVDDIDFIFGLARREDYFIRDPANVIDRIIGGRVDFQNIQKAPLIDAFTNFAGIAGVPLMGIQTIDGFGKNYGQRGFSCSAGAAEEVGMADILTDDSLPLGVDNLFLPHVVIKVLRSPFTIEG